MILPPTNEGDNVYYARDFYDLNSGKFVGLILLGMNETVLAGSYQSHFNYEDSRGMILDRDGHILSHVDKGMIGKVAAPAIRELESGRPRELLLNGRRQLVAARELGDHGLRAIVVVPHAEVFGGLNDSIANYLYMSTALALLFIFISFLLSRQVTKHIDVLVNKFELVHEGDFSIQIEEYEELELRKLSRIFNEMMRHIQYLIRDVYEKQLLLKEAELKGLRAQINPHFVFNTLLSIGFKAKKSDNEEVFEMVNSLSELLQLSVYTSPDEKTSVANELQTLSYYVKLQQIRFADRMTIDISQIEEEVRELAIPKLCLQPLVENAILHGLEPQVGPGNLVLRGRKDRGLLIFEVLDDGVGFDTSQVDLEGPVTAEKHDNNHTNIGLVNTHKRIQHLYGAAYGLELQSEKGNGTKVIVRIPSESFRE